jgi:heterodisulfide reductase subunit C
MDDVESCGRAQELSLMNRFFLKRKDPALPMSFIPLGVKMLGKGKLHIPNNAQRGRLKAMFAKAREMEISS